MIIPQEENKRNNNLLTFNGETRTLSSWSRLLNLSRGAIDKRLRLGWGVEKALTTPHADI